MAPAEPAELSPAVELDHVRFRYEGGPDILQIPSLVIERRERIFLYRPSGSGKTTLLRLLAGVLRATEGSVRVLGHNLTALSARQRDIFRGAHIDYIFQLFNRITYALSVTLLIGVEHVRLGARESFANTISQTDVIVGARGGALQLLLYTVFRVGSATNNIAYESYEYFRNHPAVAWTIPYSLGDSHRGFRVVGTTEDFYRNYRYRRDRQVELAEGRIPSDIFDVALGSDVAAELKYRLGDHAIITHGITHGTELLEHDDKPFTVVGILKRTATPVDRSLYITLEGMEAMHLDWSEGAPPLLGEAIPAWKIAKEEITIKQITAFLLRARSRIDTLRLQREVNTFEDEPLMAIIPGVTFGELWRTIGYAEDALRVVSLFVVIIGLLGMLVSLYTALTERRREMAVLRAVGAAPLRIVLLLVLESGFLSMGGAIVGVLLVYALSFISQPLVERHFGLFIPIQPLTVTAYLYVLAVIVAGLLIGFVPALQAYRNSLADGLTMRL